jgi:hypothetical protein
MTGEQEWANRAIDAWDALWRDAVRRRWRSGRTLLDGPHSRARAAVWPYSQVLAASLDVALVTGDPEPAIMLLDDLEHYRVGPHYAPFPGSDELYFDDNAWLGLAFAQAHHQMGDARYLAAAERIAGVLAGGEHPRGGVAWRRQATPPRNTCATAPAAQVALLVHGRTGDHHLRDFADRCLAFLGSRLRGDDHLYADHLAPTGQVDQTRWTYNQGTPVGALLLRARTLPAAEAADAVQQAEDTARAALLHYGVEDRLWGQPAAFNGVYFRNLRRVAGPLGHHARTACRSYLERAWTTARDTRGWLLGGGIGRYDGAGTIDQAALVQLLALEALPDQATAHIL